jgi:hypothetical protein
MIEEHEEVSLLQRRFEIRIARADIDDECLLALALQPRKPFLNAIHVAESVRGQVSGIKIGVPAFIFVRGVSKDEFSARSRKAGAELAGRLLLTDVDDLKPRCVASAA